MLKKVPQELFQSLSDEAMMAILLFNDKRELVYANQLAFTLFEMPMQYDLTQFQITQICPTSISDRRMRLFSEETMSTQGMYQEIAMRKLNNQMFIATLGLKKVSSQNTDYTVLMVQDITLQKKLQREILEKQNAIHQAYQDLLEQNRQLKELDLAKNRFIAMTTHELRTPLSAIAASGEILVLKLFDSDEQRDEFIKMIYDQAQHMLNLVNDILDFAKIQANKMDYYIEEKNAYSSTEVDVEALQNMATSSDVTLSIRAKNPNHSYQCFYDELRLKQVVSNLINNSIKYNKPKGSVDVWLDENQDWVEIHVKDTGKGIAPENITKVFNEFETLGNVANHSKGTGLGLPISRRLIESMGGTIQLESELGVGSHFWIQIPKKKVLSEDQYRSRPDQMGDLAA